MKQFNKISGGFHINTRVNCFVKWKLSFLLVIAVFLSLIVCGRSSESENNNVINLKYVWGDALNNVEALGADGQPYPWEEAEKLARRQRIPRSLFSEAPPLLSPEETRAALLRGFEQHHLEFPSEGGPEGSFLLRNSGDVESKSSKRKGRASQESLEGGCVPPRLCETTYNTTAPMYGISLTSGQPVTIVQKFPDLLQQVVYQVCKSEECDVIQGQCVQTYLPYLFLVIPLGPVTLTGQDYVLVESGCACKPKYAKRLEDPPPIPFIKPLNNSKPRNNKRF